MILLVITSSVILVNSSTSESLTEIASWIVKLILIPRPKGKKPNLKNFHELFIVIGTTYAEGAYLQRIFNPLLANSLGFPFLVRVPSGKITADRFVYSIYSDNFLISIIACLGSFLSIKTDPPWFKL